MIPISEASFLQQVKALAYIHGWDCHHASPTQTAKGRWLTSGAVGFPDLVLCHKVKGLIFAELKTLDVGVGADGWSRRRKHSVGSCHGR